MDYQDLHVFSETGPLRTVLLHCPGRELENLTPNTMKDLLFDDIPDVVRARKEFEAYLEIYRKAGVKTLFTEELLAESLSDETVRERFVSDFLDWSLLNEKQKQALMPHFLDMDPKTLSLELIRGLRKEEAPEGSYELFEDLNGSECPMILNPLVNLYFTRDPFMVIGNCVSINHMYYPARRRETLIAEYIFRHHPVYGGVPVIMNDQDPESYIEGGDILLLDEETIAIGMSQRTNAKAILHLAKELFLQDNGHLKHVLAFEIPATRAFMHLDTVFTMLDTDCFVVHPEIEDTLHVTDITWDGKELHTKGEDGSLKEILEKHLGLDEVKLIPCGGGSKIDAAREQWNDGSNTLALAPGEIIVYDRNYVTNELFDKAGLKLHEIPAAEISRGRGGPHCMSMPFHRDLLN